MTPEHVHAFTDRRVNAWRSEARCACGAKAPIILLPVNGKMPAAVVVMLEHRSLPTEYVTYVQLKSESEA